MKVKILEVASSNLINGEIRIGKKSEMPSMQTGWQFNFDKHIKLPNSKTYVLVKGDSLDVIEGCLVFELKNKVAPYMAYVEVAPHNKGKTKQLDFIGGCLIAFAYKLSLEKGVGHHKGFLTFDVLESKQQNQVKLMALYSQKYKARAINKTTMLILPKDGKMLIEEYLKR